MEQGSSVFCLSSFWCEASLPAEANGPFNAHPLLSCAGCPILARPPVTNLCRNVGRSMLGLPAREPQDDWACSRCEDGSRCRMRCACAWAWCQVSGVAEGGLEGESRQRMEREVKAVVWAARGCSCLRTRHCADDHLCRGYINLTMDP